MAIFSAGCIKSTGDKKTIREAVYKLAKHDLDSPAMKISIRKSPTCINYIAFLPKEKIKQENILKAVSQCNERTVIIFELDYKHVGVVCEYKRITDYILDKPVEFAQERGYKEHFVDNADGSNLISFNLDQTRREVRTNYMTLIFSILFSIVVFYGGYTYMLEVNINKNDQEILEKEYKNIVKKEFERSNKITKKVDTVNLLKDIESLTKITQSALEQVAFENNDFCAKVKTKDAKTFITLLPKNIKVKSEGKDSGIVHYCYNII